MNDERDPTVVRPAAGGNAADPDATVRRPPWAFWRGKPTAPVPPAPAEPEDDRDHTEVRSTLVMDAWADAEATDEPTTDPATDGPRSDPGDDSDATVIRNTVVRPVDATVVDTDRTLQRGTTLRPLPKRSLALPRGLQVHEYRIERVLGQGGFGITYLATDVNLDAKVAIKEYLPEEIAFRANDRSVSPHASQHRDRYQQGLDNFLTEARTLASFRHPNIVRVARFFEAHSTAYMVLEYERGRSFKQWWARQAPPAPGQPDTAGERLLVERLQPLLDGLSLVHASGYLHRDIKPDNIQVRAEDGRLVLLDFGSAGQTVALADQDAVVVTPGYAPIEQYGLGGQGAWTDLYALAATLYWAVAGRKPPDAEARASGISMPAAAEVGKGRFGRAFLEAIDWALHMDPAQRPQSVDAWRQRLLADHVASLGAHESQRRDDQQALDDAQQPGRAAWRARLRTWGRRWRDAALPLQARVLALVLGATLVPLSLAALLALGSARGMLHDALLRKAEGAAVGAAARVAQLVATGTRLARGLAADPGVARALAAADDAAFADLQARLQGLARHNPDIDGLWVTDATGAVRLAPVPPAMRPPGESGAPDPAAPVALPAAAITFVAQPSGAGLLLAEPVRNAAGTLLGRVHLQLKPAALAAVLNSAGADDGGAPMLVDDDGVVVQHLRAELLYRGLQPLAAGSPAAQRAVQRYGRSALQPLGEAPLAAVLQGPRAPGRLSDRWAADGAPLLAGYAPVPGQRWTVLVLQPSAALQAPLSRLRTHLLAGMLLTVGVVAVLARRFARRLVQPLQALTIGAEALKAGHPEQAYVNVQRRDEIGQLARTFNGTVDVLRQRDRERATRRRR